MGGWGWGASVAPFSFEGGGGWLARRLFWTPPLPPELPAHPMSVRRVTNIKPERPLTLTLAQLMQHLQLAGLLRQRGFDDDDDDNEDDDDTDNPEDPPGPAVLDLNTRNWTVTGIRLNEDVQSDADDAEELEDLDSE